jgi:hypothetical protein
MSEQFIPQEQTREYNAVNNIEDAKREGKRYPEFYREIREPGYKLHKDLIGYDVNYHFINDQLKNQHKVFVEIVEDQDIKTTITERGKAIKEEIHDNLLRNLKEYPFESIEKAESYIHNIIQQLTSE